MKTKLQILLIIQMFLLLPVSLKSQVTTLGNILPGDFPIPEITSNAKGKLHWIDNTAMTETDNRLKLILL